MGKATKTAHLNPTDAQNKEYEKYRKFLDENHEKAERSPEITFDLGLRILYELMRQDSNGVRLVHTERKKVSYGSAWFYRLEFLKEKGKLLQADAPPARLVPTVLGELRELAGLDYSANTEQSGVIHVLYDGASHSIEAKIAPSNYKIGDVVFALKKVA